MAVHIHGDGNDVHVARALAVAEQRALHAVRAGQQAQFGVGHAAAPVVVRVQACLLYTSPTKTGTKWRLSTAYWL